jgi:hypothetical protein
MRVLGSTSFWMLNRGFTECFNRAFVSLRLNRFCRLNRQYWDSLVVSHTAGCNRVISRYVGRPHIWEVTWWVRCSGSGTVHVLIATLQRYNNRITTMKCYSGALESSGSCPSCHIATTPLLHGPCRSFQDITDSSSSHTMSQRIENLSPKRESHARKPAVLQRWSHLINSNLA